MEATKETTRRKSWRCGGGAEDMERRRGEEGGFEEAALRTRTTERPVRRQSVRGGRSETHTEGKMKKEK